MSKGEVKVKHEEVTFSFGENWKDYLKAVSEADMSSSKQDIEDWLSEKGIFGKEFIDVGSGSGLHSLSFSL